MIFNFSYFVLCCVIGYSILITFKNLYLRRLAMPQLRIPSHEASTRSTDFASPAELLSKLSIFWFSLLSPKDQQDKIEQISNKLAAEDVNVGSPAAAAAGETKEDVRRKAFEMLFNEVPVVTRVDLFKEITKIFFDERRLCEGIPLSRQLGSNEQQEEIDEIKQSRYAEFYLGLSIIWFKARCASDPRNLIQVVVGKAGVEDDIFEKLVNETEEDFKLRKFTESFKQLQFSSQEEIVEFIQDAVFRDLVDDVPNTFEMREDVSNTIEMSDGVSGNRFYGKERVRGNDELSDDGRCRAGNINFREPLLEFLKVRTPNLRGAGGATATQGGRGGQGAITQGGQGTSQQ
ncbi:PREDICTED: uncharacterized protein LOC103339457 [Prunus mume]|uniref:Uncharacterized protein LOC103339457 n=1 Tax=Prunus mume TaxID=102107 RepID=A0ABM0PKN1_PRUMU|nr:PREDICTED: uncharacterized protein LOC103339457 [Prunus mume]